MRRFGFALLAAGLIGGAACSDDDGNAGVASELLYVSGDDQQAAINTQLPQPFVVEVVTAGGEPVEGVQLRWEVPDGGSVNDASTNTDADGRSSVTFTLGSTAGTYNVQVAAPGLDIGEVIFTATADGGGGGGGGGGEL